jgi:AraC family transcriptional regulator
VAIRRERAWSAVTDFNRLEYEKRVNTVIDYIREHLSGELSLAELARVAAFSPFHFHRVFKALTDETLFGYIQRLRIERAAGALTSRPDLSVLEVALDHGFSSAATFARAFRAYFGMSATQWRGGGADRWRERRQPEGKAGKLLRNPGKAGRGARADTFRRRAEEGPMTVHVRALPAYHVAYMRYVGPYGADGIPELWLRLRRWMQARELDGDTAVKLGIGYDDPGITKAEKCRYDACVVVPRNFVADRWVNLMGVPAGTYAIAEFTGTAHEIEGAWECVFGAWLPNSGYQPDDRPGVEMYRGNPNLDGKAGAFRCELCLPVRPL